MENMRFKVGDRVRIKSLDWYNKNKTVFEGTYFVSCDGGRGSFTDDMVKYCGEIVTIKSVDPYYGCYFIKEDKECWLWTDEMIECKGEEETKPKYEDEVNGEYYSTPKYLVRPSGYQFKDENGNVINATKIVLEKKSPKTDDITEMMKMNNMKRNACQKCVFAVYDDKPHCGLRGFRSDFNVERCSAEGDTIPNGYELQEDGYFSWVDKKKEYPKTFLGCCDVLNIGNLIERGVKGYKAELFDTLQKLYICRDAYWKIAGREMGLGKPWEPDWTNQESPKYCIASIEGQVKAAERHIINTILAFPTEEMRDAFYENFKKEIEICKELL